MHDRFISTPTNEGLCVWSNLYDLPIHKATPKRYSATVRPELGTYTTYSAAQTESGHQIRCGNFGPDGTSREFLDVFDPVAHSGVSVYIENAKSERALPAIKYFIKIHK